MLPSDWFLFQAGHVDKAHHKGWAKKALEEVLELELAVETALNMTNEEETLIIVTADHSHSLTINGYPRQGMSIHTQRIESHWSQIRRPV